MTSLVEALGSRTIGTVETVSARGISVLLDPEAPQATALNTGRPAGFPRINGYLLVPNEAGATVGVITKVEVARLPYPKRKGMRDFGLVDLPFPARMVSLTPLGTLFAQPDREGNGLGFEVRRGVDVFPSVGDPVLLPTADQLRAIVEGEAAGQTRRVLIGTCPTAAGAPVHVDPDKLFGRHLAVLGNTGAGKSCSVAGLVRWSLEAAREKRAQSEREGEPNARFIVLDPNGEYTRAFEGLNVRLFQVEPGESEPARPLKVPAWLWSGHEWAAFAEAAPRVQRPILFDAIRRLRSGVTGPDAFQIKSGHRIRNYRLRLRLILQAGGHMGFPAREDCASVLTNTRSVFTQLAADPHCSDDGLRVKFQDVANAAERAERSARSYVDKHGVQRHNDIDDTDLENVIDSLDELGQAVGLGDDEGLVSEDAPRHFPVRELADVVETLASERTGGDLAQFVGSLNLRIKGLLAPGPLSSVLDPSDSASISLDEWLTEHIGADQASNGSISIVDLSLVPSEVIHMVVAVMARLVFEAVQRYRRLHKEPLPTVLILEEAHTFVHRDLTADIAPQAGKTCCRTFERIAREGRKFGLGLVVASQRPSEMSPTVLSQCNTFLLHRIVNDKDQDLVRRLVPDALGNLLRELPSLPTQRAILLGWGAPTPVLVEVRHLTQEHRPHSPDPDFWQVWTGETARSVDWKAIADEWASRTKAPAAQPEEPRGEVQ